MTEKFYDYLKRKWISILHNLEQMEKH
jgi:hypothetical protein